MATSGLPSLWKRSILSFPFARESQQTFPGLQKIEIWDLVRGRRLCRVDLTQSSVVAFGNREQNLLRCRNHFVLRLTEICPRNDPLRRCHRVVGLRSVMTSPSSTASDLSSINRRSFLRRGAAAAASIALPTARAHARSSQASEQLLTKL